MAPQHQFSDTSTSRHKPPTRPRSLAKRPHVVRKPVPTPQNNRSIANATTFRSLRSANTWPGRGSRRAELNATMKAIRRSLKGDREQKHAPHNSIGPKSAIAIIPPKKVIKALYDYEPSNKHGHELAFHKGDFFHVLSRENDTEWYEACNPLIPDARGLVPVAFFEVIGKQQRQSGNSIRSAEGHDSGFSEKGAGPLSATASSFTTTTISPPVSVSAKAGPGIGPGIQHMRQSSSMRSQQPPNGMVYGIVLYDFNAERPDELEAKQGEAIIVVAQSNPEWFVAKPIGRLGGPGLIPVSFIEVKDTMTGQSVTDPLDAVRKAGVPKVEEWKKTAAEYKNSSISLGRLEQPAQLAQGMEKMTIQGGQPQQPPFMGANSAVSNTYSQTPGQQSLPNQVLQTTGDTPLAPVSASVPRYCFDNDMYWYIIECQMEDGRWWELSRYYADFYDFQIALLEAFPLEAGNRGQPRKLPFMPGPVAHVTDAISNGRRKNLDEYIKNILRMEPHISKSTLVRNLFKPRPGQDFEIDPNAVGEDYRLSDGAGSQNSFIQDNITPAGSSHVGVQAPRGTSSSGPNGNVTAARPPMLHAQASTITQNSTTSATSKSGNAGPNSSAVGSATANNAGNTKIKVFFEDDIVIIRVPSDISFLSLKDRLVDRLKLNDNEPFRVQYKDEASNQLVEMRNDDHLEHAMAVCSRLQLHVSYVNP